MSSPSTISSASSFSAGSPLSATKEPSFIEELDQRLVREGGECLVHLQGPSQEAQTGSLSLGKDEINRELLDRTLCETLDGTLGRTLDENILSQEISHYNPHDSLNHLSHTHNLSHTHSLPHTRHHLSNNPSLTLHDTLSYAALVSQHALACKQLDAVMLPQCQRLNRSGNHEEGWFLLRKNPQSIENIIEVRVAVVGNVDAGKSTMLGVLTSGALDDGRGKARVGLFRHKHEIESGRTSSIGQECLAFDSHGRVIVHSNTSSRKYVNDEIIPEAHKVITFMDLAGHERYLKTTMFGLTGGAPDYAMLMVGANAGLIGMAKEHLAMTFALSTPVMVVVTKVDMSPPNILEGTIRQLHKVLKSPSARRTPMMIKSDEDVIVATKNFVAQRLCPIFQVSNVTGEGIDLLKSFLHLLPQGRKYGAAEAPAEFQITDTYVVPGVGTVVAGTMISGTISLGQTLYLGPDTVGNFMSCQIKGVQRKRATVHKVYAGQCASFALKKIKRSMIRKGMVMVGKELAIQPPPESHACLEFEAEVVILFHSTTIGPKYQAMLHCGVVRQTVSLVSMQNDVLRTGDRALVRFRFMKFPEYLKVGSRLLFREGRTKGVGKITALYD